MLLSWVSALWLPVTAGSRDMAPRPRGRQPSPHRGTGHRTEVSTEEKPPQRCSGMAVSVSFPVFRDCHLSLVQGAFTYLRWHWEVTCSSHCLTRVCVLLQGSFQDSVPASWSADEWLSLSEALTAFACALRHLWRRWLFCPHHEPIHFFQDHSLDSH